VNLQVTYQASLLDENRKKPYNTVSQSQKHSILLSLEGIYSGQLMTLKTHERPLCLLLF